jgi:hypothetical protein
VLVNRKSHWIKPCPRAPSKQNPFHIFMPPIETVLKIFYVAGMVKSFPSSEFLPLAPKQILSKL